MAAACPSCRGQMKAYPSGMPGMTKWECPKCGGGSWRPTTESDFPPEQAPAYQGAIGCLVVLGLIAGAVYLLWKFVF